MDFGTLPPEITAALIHSGPGAGTLIEASVVWQQLATELEESVPSYASVLSSLTDAWQGPSSAAMIPAVEPFLTWLRTTAGQCQRVGSSMQAVAAAFELAHRTVVFPVQVSANRTRLAQLLATNWFGTNLVAIADTEAQYEGMWVNNSAAMYRYRAASAQALALPQFSSPPAIADPTALAAQAGAAPAASAAPTLSSIASELSTLSDSIVSNPWFQLANAWGNQFIAGGIPVNLLGVLAQLQTAKGFQTLGGEVGQGLAQVDEALGAAEADLAGALEAAAGSVPTAAVGVGVSVGKLTMPPAVVGLLPASQPPVRLASAAFPLSSGGFGLPSTPLPPLMMPPRVAARARKREGRDYEDIEYGLELMGTVMQRPPSAG